MRKILNIITTSIFVLSASSVFAEDATKPELKINCNGLVDLASGESLKIPPQSFPLKLQPSKNREKGVQAYSVRARVVTADKKYGIRFRATIGKVDTEYKALRVIYQFERKEADGSIKVLAVSTSTGEAKTKDSAGQQIPGVFMVTSAVATNTEYVSLLINSEKNLDRGTEAGILSDAPYKEEDLKNIAPKDMALDADFSCYFAELNK